MKSNAKSNLIIIGILFALLPIITTNLSYIMDKGNKSWDTIDDFTLDMDNLKISKISGKIHIDNNWTATKSAGICTGNGTYSEPYVIKDLEINGGDSGSCILIENSDVYFKIENCTLNAGDSHPNAGIRLNNVTKGVLVINNCSFSYIGIYLSHCDNISISGNIANHNHFGIYLSVCNDINISGNTATNNYNGMNLSYCDNAVLSGNIMNKCGLTISGVIEQLKSHNIDVTNLVNGKPLYYYNNEKNLGPDDFLDAGQVLLVNCNDSLISNLNISFSNIAISLYYCYNNIISGNAADNNHYGIYLSLCENSFILGNTASDNNYGICLHDCYNNTISGNTASNNNYWGIYLALCYDNILSGNTANNNSRGIFSTVSSNNIISGNTANDNSFYGIELYFSDYNTVSGNTANNNSFYGIYLFRSRSNTISGNILIGNNECIYEENCIGNTFSDNGDCMYGQGSSGVPIELIILVSVISGGAVIGVVVLLLIRRTRKIVTII